MKKLICLFVGSFIGGAFAADYPNMEGVWAGTIRTVSSGEQVRDQVARGGALIQELELKLSVSYQDEEVYMGESVSDAPDSQPVPVWGAIRSTGKEGVFVTANGGRGNLWFITPTQLEFCFANQTQAQMSAYCGRLDKR